MGAPEQIDALVIGAGPAGLMAADVLAQAGVRVCVAEAKPSPARKFLMAGKSGLNLTKDEPLRDFIPRFDGAAGFLRDILSEFDPSHVQRWARALGVELFRGSTGRVFPVAMKASPLLRAWLARLGASGVDLRRDWRWAGWDGAGDWLFATPKGAQSLAPRVVVLALGGGSWARLGSDGAWAPMLATRGVPIVPFAPANAALRVNWSQHMAAHFGRPVKGIALHAGGRQSRGEMVISAKGLEGGGLYPLTPVLRDGADLMIDLKPDLTVQALAAKLARARGKASLSQYLRKVLRFDPAHTALLNEFARPLPEGPDLAAMIKALPIRHAGLAPLDEAISTAGGIALSGLGPDLQLAALPSVFAAGEMLDWEAPTGGYLITACLATGQRAGRGALAYLAG